MNVLLYSKTWNVQVSDLADGGLKSRTLKHGLCKAFLIRGSSQRTINNEEKSFNVFLETAFQKEVGELMGCHHFELTEITVKRNNITMTTLHADE